MQNKIDRTRLIHSFYQVNTPKKYTWLGVNSQGNAAQKKAHDKERKKRPIELKTTDILIKSDNGNFNKINKNGAVNIVIPENYLRKVDETILFDDDHYERGFQKNGEKL
jgi:hypothetical protein